MYKFQYIKEYDSKVLYLKDNILLQANGKQVNVDCLWDSGSSGSCISRNLIEYLSLDPIGTCDLHGSCGEKKTSIYIVDIMIFPQISFQTYVSEFVKSNQSDFDLIIGMDIISKGRFVVNNKDNHTIVSFEYSFDPESDHVQI